MTKRSLSPAIDAKLTRRKEFCDKFVRDHHPRMSDEKRSKGAQPLVPLLEPSYCPDGNGHMIRDWWLETDNSMSALGSVWIAHLLNRHGAYDHAWSIGRDDQDVWALVSEPYSSRVTGMKALISDLNNVGVQLIEFPSEMSTHYPGGVLMLVANIKDHYRLLGAVARHIANVCES